jgi:hypothetical protein
MLDKRERERGEREREREREREEEWSIILILRLLYRGRREGREEGEGGRMVNNVDTNIV